MSPSAPSSSYSADTLPKTCAVILAAGQGTRMKSALPKVLHTVAGRPLVYYPVHAALDAGCEEVIVVVGHGRVQVEDYLKSTFGDLVKTALQEQQRGTGDAVRAALPHVGNTMARLLVFYGDVPLLTADDLKAVTQSLDTHAAIAAPASGGGASGESALALATCVLDTPFGYGRIVRDAQGRIAEVREQKDLKTEQERAIREINPGIYAGPTLFFHDAVAALSPNNAQGEYYLTDIVGIAANGGHKVIAVPSRAEVLVGVNDRAQLADAERAMTARILQRCRVSGVTVRDTARIDDTVDIAPDAVIEAGAVLRGKTRVGRGTTVDVGCVLTNALIGEGVTLKPYSVITDSIVDARAQIGPFSHLRPESIVGEDAHVGNFVETKKTRLGKGAKANHLAYLGDGIIGEGANVGAGTIFCNYDGFQKHTTVIGKNAFIGSDSQLVAPITIGDGAYVGTGTTVTRDVPPDALAIGRAKQENKEGYGLRLRAKLKAAKSAKEAKRAAGEGGAGGTQT